MLMPKGITTASVALGAALLLSSAPPQSRGQKKPAENQGSIRVNVEMVSLPVVVTTRDGRRITDLKQEDFKIFEDGVEQTISGFAATDEPVSVALALDTSGSTEEELANIQNAAIEFVYKLHPDDDVAVLSFAEDTKLQGDFTINRDKNEYGIKKTRSGGCTVLYEAVWLALEDVLKPVQQRKALVLFTDGVDTCSRKASTKDTQELAQETRATIYSVYYDTQNQLYTRQNRPTIGGYPGGGLPPVIGTGRYPGGYPGGGYPGGGYPYPGSGRGDYMRGHEYLKKLSELSGGAVFDGNQNLQQAFEEVAKELASQYSIGYYSSNPKHDGKFRRVEVKLSKPDLVARTKKGYTAKKDKDAKK
jgi:VWFA-related protein